MSRAVRQVLGGIMCCALAACGAGENPTHSASALAAPSFDFEGVAHDVVVRSAQVQEGEYVLILGAPENMELLENLAVHVRRLGAHPVIEVWSHRLTRRMFDDVPEKYDTQRDDFQRALFEAADVVIFATPPQPSDLLAHVPQRRLAARRDANAAVFQILGQPGTRLVEVGNGLYPSPERARALGITERELAQLFWEGVQADPERTMAAGSALLEIFSSGRVVHVTDAAGTDFTMRIEGRTPRLSNGVVPPPGTPGGRMTWLPAGEVFVAPVPGSANGRIVAERFMWQGGDPARATVQVVDGDIVSMETDATGFQEAYELAPPGRGSMGVISIGINPGLTSQRVLGWTTAGMTTLQFGGNTYAGGELDIPWGINFHLPGTTVRVDDRVIIENGILKF